MKNETETRTGRAAHTPGPWTYICDGACLDLKGNNGNTLIAVFPSLARVEGVAYIPSDEDAANLELIRSAPEIAQQRYELLAALKALVDWMDISGLSHTKPVGVGTCFETKPGEYSVVKEARAAIARAEGGAS